MSEPFTMILFICPGVPVNQSIKDALDRNKFTRVEEIEPKAGCRRFRLS